MELDICMTEIKKALEYSGYHWHSKPEAIIRDRIKKEECKKLGIQLMVICEHDWKYSRERCEDNIKKFILG
jgi:hypothetical protein